MTKEELTPKQHSERGLEIINTFGMKVKENGRVDTLIGDKSPEGVSRVVSKLITAFCAGVELVDALVVDPLIETLSKETPGDEKEDSHVQ